MKLLFLFISFLLMIHLGYSQEYFVQPNGNDSGKGSINDPFKTIQKGLNVVAGLSNRKGAATIYVREGIYPVHSSLRLTERLSNLNIKAYQEEEVIFSGGLNIPVSAIQIIQLPRTKYLPKREVQFVDLKGLSINNYGQLKNVGFGRPYGPSWGEIFVNKKEMRLARWPNASMIPMGNVLDPGSIPRNGDYSKRGGVIAYDSVRINDWSKEDDVWMSGYFKWGYADDMVKISNIDTVNHTLATASPTLYGFGHSEPWQNWYGVNILAELDVSGEYYIDRNKGKLYFISKDEPLESLEFSILETPFFTINRSENVLIEGIIFETSRGHGIVMSNTTNVVVKACEFRNLGGLGIAIGKGIEPFKEHKHEGTGKTKENIIGSLQNHLYANSTYNREGGTNNKIIGCKFYQLGAGGISLGGGNRLTLAPGNNQVDNCEFFNINRIEKSYKPAITLTGVGNKVTHCEMYKLPSMAILMVGNNHLIEYNYIHNVCLEVEDQGALYYGRDPSERGTVVRYNYFENIPDKFSTSAVYSDDGSCGITVESNVFFRAGKMNILLGGGSDNTYRNNIFMNSKIGIHVDNRLQNWSKALLDNNGLFETRLKAVNYTQSPYSSAYPHLVTYFKNPSLPKNNVVEANVFLNVDKVIGGKKRWLVYRKNRIETDDIFEFENTSMQNISLSQKAFLFSKIPEFKNIPFHEIGLY